MGLISNEGFLKISFTDLLEYERPKRSYPFSNSEVFQTKITKIVKLTKGEDVKDVYDVTLDLTNIKNDYLPGDTIGILPNNNYDEVNQILDTLRCGNIADDKCYFNVENEKKRKSFAHIPTASTLRKTFIENVDIRSPAKKGFLKILSKYCESHDDRKFLEDICSIANSNGYTEFISKDGRTLLGLLKKIPSCHPPVDLIIENLPPLHPRPYSIASSPLEKNELHIIFSVVEIERNLKGVCSSYLERAGTNLDVIKFYFRKPSFRISDNLSPVIMVGPGTGIAPFLGFLQHLSLKGQRVDTWLFYGCRYRERDFLHQSDIKRYLEDGYLRRLSVGFSREQTDKVYVTHLMEKESMELFKKMVREDTTVYVCGDAKGMVKDVKDTFVQCLEKNGLSRNEAEQFLEQKVKEGKYIEDKWV